MPNLRVFGLQFRSALVSIAVVFGVASLSAHSATPDLSPLYDQIYQIKVVASRAGSKSAIGSGFQVTHDGLIVTNFHVVSGYVSAPHNHRIEYLDQNGESGTLELLDFNVIQDIALLRHKDAKPGYFPLNTSGMRKGELIYALGNPRDYGVTLVFGAYNGRVEHSYDRQILFSGSLNPGMSGGPGLNSAGEVIGVNVATAGSQLSFLVPANSITKILDVGRILQKQSYQEEISNQIRHWQNRRIMELTNLPWKKVALGNFQVLGEIRGDMQCWGSSNENETEHPVVVLRRGCNAGNRLFIDSGFTTGQIHYAFEHKKSRDLSPYRFHKLLSMQSLGADNQAGKNDVTNYQCDSQFFSQRSGRSEFSRGLYCVRAYIRHPDLFDVLFIAERSSNEESLSAHFTLAGVDQSQAQAFAHKFLAELAWTSF